MREPTQTFDVVVQRLYQLIDEIGNGKLLVPRFKRPVVWNWSHQSELLSSVKDGIPMGAVMIWHTLSEVAWKTELAGYVLPSPPAGLPRDYLLDGLQRLSTLFAALRAFDERETEEDLTKPIGYDLEEQVFVENFDAAVQPQVIPLHVLPDSLTLLRFQRRLKGDRADVWVERADDLAKAFREYKIPAIRIATNDLGVATRAFNLVNSQGMPMGEADMIHALSWAPGFELRDELESQRAEVLQARGWGSIEFETVLKVVKVGADLDPYEESVQQVSSLLKRDKTALERAFVQLGRVADLLRSKCGISSWELVPYSLQAVLLADAFRIVDDRDVDDLLADWFWMTTYGEMFAGLSGYRVSLAIRDLRESMNDGELRWSGPSAFRVPPIPRSADFRSVRIKAVALTLARQIAATGFSGDPFVTLSEYGREAMFQLIPHRSLDKASFSSVGNCFLCRPSDATALRNRVLSAQLDSHERNAHMISEDALTAARTGSWNQFVSLRCEEIKTREQDFISDLLARHPTISRSKRSDGG